MGSGRFGSRASREAQFKAKLDKNGKYEYISGYRSYKDLILVRHKACGKELYATGSMLVQETKTDYCDYCRPFPTSKGVARKNKEKLARKPQTGMMDDPSFIRYCRRESKHLIPVLISEGFLFGEDLEYYVSLCVKDFNFVMDNKYDYEECLDACLENVYKYYNEQKIGQCRCCGTVLRGMKWEGNFKERLCPFCKCVKESKGE